MILYVAPVISIMTGGTAYTGIQLVSVSRSRQFVKDEFLCLLNDKVIKILLKTFRQHFSRAKACFVSKYFQQKRHVLMAINMVLFQKIYVILPGNESLIRFRIICFQVSCILAAKVTKILSSNCLSHCLNLLFIIRICFFVGCGTFCPTTYLMWQRHFLPLPLSFLVWAFFAQTTFFCAIIFPPQLLSSHCRNCDVPPLSAVPPGA